MVIPMEVPLLLPTYKIITDCENQPFKIDLPAHLKQRGMHDVFHASLLYVHVPDDDCLFSGCANTQLSSGDDSEGEWAVDKIPSHS